MGEAEDDNGSQLMGFGHYVLKWSKLSA